MKKFLLLTLAGAVLLALAAPSGTAWAQPMGPGMMGGRRMGGAGAAVTIPETLPPPANPAWIDRLRQVLALEQLSQAQYEADQARYQVHRPYRMVIPQEVHHTQWIRALFKAYGLPPDAKTPPVEQSGALDQAYALAMKLEADLIPHYQWLIANAPDPDTRQVLEVILRETQHHYRMFENARSMGGGMGPGGGRGGRGMGPMRGSP